jgi:hypothetical protein
MSCRRKINRNLARSWAIVGNSMRYKRAAVREASSNSLDDIKEEAFDGILITLSSHNSSKSLNVLKRILRRIVEKRQAQIAHRYIGHTDDLTASHLASVYSSKCMKMLR